MLDRHKVLQKQRDAPIDIDSLDNALLVEEGDGFAEGESGADIGYTRGDLVGLVICVEGIWFILQELCQQLVVKEKYHHSQNRNRR
jgi:hypothetical protein